MSVEVAPCGHVQLLGESACCASNRLLRRIESLDASTPGARGGAQDTCIDRIGVHADAGTEQIRY
ncbi:MAG: hypothetical protein ACK40S_10850 [Burkholderiaceae bacterium]